jgi:hypothetical protein
MADVQSHRSELSYGTGKSSLDRKRDISTHDDKTKTSLDTFLELQMRRRHDAKRKSEMKKLRSMNKAFQSINEAMGDTTQCDYVAEDLVDNSLTPKNLERLLPGQQEEHAQMCMFSSSSCDSVVDAPGDLKNFKVSLRSLTQSLLSTFYTISCPASDDYLEKISTSATKVFSEILKEKLEGDDQLGTFCCYISEKIDSNLQLRKNKMFKVTKDLLAALRDVAIAANNNISEHVKQSDQEARSPPYIFSELVSVSRRMKTPLRARGVDDDDQQFSVSISENAGNIASRSPAPSLIGRFKTC